MLADVLHTSTKKSVVWVVRSCSSLSAFKQLRTDIHYNLTLTDSSISSVAVCASTSRRRLIVVIRRHITSNHEFRTSTDNENTRPHPTCCLETSKNQAHMSLMIPCHVCLAKTLNLAMHLSQDALVFATFNLKRNISEDVRLAQHTAVLSETQILTTTNMISTVTCLE